MENINKGGPKGVINNDLFNFLYWNDKNVNITSVNSISNNEGVKKQLANKHKLLACKYILHIFFLNMQFLLLLLT